MKPGTQPGSRIVSRKEYLLVQSRKAWLCTKAMGMGVAGAGTLILLIRAIHPGMSHVMVLAGVILLQAVLFARWYVKDTIKEIRAMEPVVPVTRANTADLPAIDSLVRASQEPEQAQETVLLRAGGAGQEQHEEQLLRAATGKHERA